MYRTCMLSASSSSSPNLSRLSMAHRKAARVFPDPVGASSSVLSPFLITGHALTCAGDGLSKVAANQRETAGVNALRALCSVFALLFGDINLLPYRLRYSQIPDLSCYFVCFVGILPPYEANNAFHHGKDAE